jgi:mannose-6-phosphate isomerase-like protein (cupin superfamily)
MIRRAFLGSTLAAPAAAFSFGLRPAAAGPDILPAASKINADYFIGYWKETKSRRLYGSLEVWDLLTHAAGDPLRPKKRGAVLTALNCVSYASLAPRTSTRTTRLSGVQYIFYIASGFGTIRSGRKKVEIRQGFGIIIPPGVEFTLANTGNNPLTLFVIEEPLPLGFKPAREMVVKNDFDHPISTNARRLDYRFWLFTPRDGLAAITGMDQIVFMPRTYVPPHVHLPEEEEVWIALDDMKIQIGREQRLLPAGSAYKPPADSTTPHVNINDTTENKRLLWLMKHRLTDGEPEEREERRRLPDNVI